MAETIQNNLARLRQSAGITQQALAEGVGVTRQTVIAIERGNYVPSVLLALKVAKFFRQPVEYIFKVQHDGSRA
jgi:putative transcriptional regulator